MLLALLNMTRVAGLDYENDGMGAETNDSQDGFRLRHRLNRDGDGHGEFQPPARPHGNDTIEYNLDIPNSHRRIPIDFYLNASIRLPEPEISEGL